MSAQVAPLQNNDGTFATINGPSVQNVEYGTSNTKIGEYTQQNTAQATSAQKVLYDQISENIKNLTNEKGVEPSTVFKKVYSNYKETTTGSWLNEKFIFVSLPMTKRLLIGIIVAFMVMFILVVVLGALAAFENKNDPYGAGIRFLQGRDDTGSPSTTLDDRKYRKRVSQLTSTPEAPNFSEYYGIEADVKNGSVMIERENFENNALSVRDLEKANKGH